MLKPVWLPGNPLRFVSRDGKKILQQVWTKMVDNGDDGWVNSSDYVWADVPLMVEGESDPAYWVRDEAP